MNLSHIEHIGIAVKSLEDSIPYWEKVFGLKCYAIEEVAETIGIKKRPYLIIAKEWD